MQGAAMSDYSYHDDDKILPGSSYSSLSSDSSSASCGKSSPHPSSLGLRRSTIDLSDLASSGSSLSSKHYFKSSAARSSDTSIGESWSAGRLKPRSTYERKHHRGIEAIVHDTFLDTLPLIDLTKAFSNLLSNFVHSSRTDVAMNVHRYKNTQRSKSTEETKVDDDYDDNLSPCQIHISQFESADEWDHFADFQDRIMDEEVIAFSPFKACKSKGKLDTLDEIEEEEEDMDVFSF